MLYAGHTRPPVVIQAMRTMPVAEAMACTNAGIVLVAVTSTIASRKRTQ